MKSKPNLNIYHCAVTTMKSPTTRCRAKTYSCGKLLHKRCFQQELPKLPWTSLYLTSLELANYDEDMKERILYDLYNGPCGIKMNDFSRVEIHKDDNAEEVMNVDPTEVQCPENVVRKEEKLCNSKELCLQMLTLSHVNSLKTVSERK